MPSLSAPTVSGVSFASVLIVNGTVYDGSLGPATETNIGITGDRIVSTNAPADADAACVACRIAHADLPHLDAGVKAAAASGHASSP